MITIDDLKETIIKPGDNLFLTPGAKAQLIGSQNGGFQAFGHHIENEMGGVWMHPIKVLDGFWFGLKKNNETEYKYLDNAHKFSNYPYYNTLKFEDVEGISIERKHFVPKDKPALIVEFEMKNTKKEKQTFNFSFLAKTDLRPVWYSENANILPGKEEGRITEHLVSVQAVDNPWYTELMLEGANNLNIHLDQYLKTPDKTYGEGIGVSWEFALDFLPNESKKITFKITGSIKSDIEAKAVMHSLEDIDKLFLELKNHYGDIISMANINVPNEELMKQYAWVKCHMEWLTTDVPHIGRGLTAGIPEYPWWFGCDSAYSLAGATPVGFHKLAQQTLDLVADSSHKTNGNGRIVHEINTYGIVGNKGNTQETPHFIRAIYNTYLWTGDFEWLRKHYPLVKQGLDWVLHTMDKDGDLFPEGYGIIEVLGLNGELIDTAAYTADALICASKMAKIFNDLVNESKYRELGEKLIRKINSEMWLEKEQVYADIRVPGKILYKRLDDFIMQAKLHTDDHIVEYYESMKQEFRQQGVENEEGDTSWCFKNWVINTPLELGMQEKDKALKSLSRLNSDEYIGEYGMYLSGLAQTAMMTISTAVQINSNLKYQNSDEALVLMEKIMKTFNRYLPGSISEMSPDYGCFVQAWTSYGLLSPLVTGFVGVSPNAYKKEMHLNPNLPSDWSYTQLKELKVGENIVSINVERKTKNNEEYLVEVDSLYDDWTFTYPNNVEVKFI